MDSPEASKASPRWEASSRFPGDWGNGRTGRSLSRSELLLRAGWFSLAFFLCAQLGRFLSVRDTSYVSFWLPGGLYTAMLMLHEPRAWGWFILAALPANVAFDLLQGTPPLTILGFFSANTAEALLGAYLTRRFVAAPPRLESLAEFLRLIVTGPLIAPVAGATLGAANLVLSGFSPSYANSWLTWWSGEAMALLLVAPLVLVWFGEHPSEESRWAKTIPERPREALVLISGLVGLTWYLLVMEGGISTNYKHWLMPFVLWAGLRFGRRGVTVVNLILALLLAYFTTRYQRGLSDYQISHGDYVLAIQSFLLMASMIGLIPAIVLGERDRYERELERREERFKTLTHASFEALFVSENGIVVEANEEAARLLQRDASAIHGKRLEALLPRPQTDASSTGETAFEVRIQRPDLTSVYIEVRTRTVSLGSRQFQMTAVRDISPQRKSEAERRRLELQLRQAQKMEAVGTLAGGIAHDFNNTLAIIVGFAELARLEMHDDHPAHGHLEQILAASRRAGERVRQLLTFSRRRPQELRKQPLVPIVEDAMRLLRPTLPSTLRVTLGLPPALPDVLADASQIQQVLTNLVNNAVQAMKGQPGDLRIQLSVYTQEIGTPTPHEDLHDSDYVVMSVQDSGHGMDETIVSRVFEPFFTTKPPGEGTGLGLSVVHGILRDHHGAAVVRSQPGKGTTFEIYLPIAAPDAPAAESRRQSTPTGSGERIYVVDDEPGIVETVSGMLTRLGYEAISFQNALEAAEALRTAPGNCDLLLTDLTMPDLTGLDLAGVLHDLSPSTPIIVMSGFGGSVDWDRLKTFGLNDILAKPFDVQTLALAVKRAINGTQLR